MRKQTLQPQPMSQGRLKLVLLAAYSFGEFLCDLIISEDTNEKDIRRQWILESERRDLMHPSILMNQIALKRVPKGLTQIELKQQLQQNRYDPEKLRAEDDFHDDAALRRFSRRVEPSWRWSSND